MKSEDERGDQDQALLDDLCALPSEGEEGCRPCSYEDLLAEGSSPLKVCEGQLRDLRTRTKRYALWVMDLIDLLPNTIKGRTAAGQLCRSGTSVGANYRAVCRARSRAEFIAKVGTVIEEVDESVFWLELIIEGRLLPREKVQAVLDEGLALTAIMVQSKKTAMANKDKVMPAPARCS